MKNLTNKPDSPLSNDPLIRRHLASHDTLEWGIIISVGLSILAIILSTVSVMLSTS